MSFWALMWCLGEPPVGPHAWPPSAEMCKCVLAYLHCFPCVNVSEASEKVLELDLYHDFLEYLAGLERPAWLWLEAFVLLGIRRGSILKWVTGSLCKQWFDGRCFGYVCSFIALVCVDWPGNDFVDSHLTMNDYVSWWSDILGWWWSL